MNRRILLLITDLQIGGTPTVVRELAIRLNNPTVGVTVEVACLAAWGPVADQLKTAGVSVTAFNARGARDFISAVWKLLSLIRRQKIDTVLSFLIHANTIAAIASLGLSNVRFLQSIQTTQRWPRWHWWVQSWIHDFADRIVVPSSAVAKVAQSRSHVSSQKIKVIPNAIDPADFPRVQVFQRSPLRVGFLGRLDPVKNIPALIDAMLLLKEEPVECHIFGEGPEREKIEKQIENNAQRARIFLRGAVSRPQVALAEIDILVLPSLGEGFGLVLVEAMASGIPVIGSAIPGAAAASDIITDGVNGFLVGADGNIDQQIADCVRRLINEPELRRRLIDGGFRTIRDKFTWSAVLPEYQTMLRLNER